MDAKEFQDKLVAWVFEHTKQAYTKDFWVNTFNLTNDDLVKFGIIYDLES